jgi:hypothetical protein
MYRVQKFCTRVLGMAIYMVHSKKVATATHIVGNDTEDIVVIHVHCVSGNIPDQMDNFVYFQVLDVLLNDTVSC